MALNEADLQRERHLRAERATRRERDLSDALLGIPATEPERRPTLGEGGKVEWH